MRAETAGPAARKDRRVRGAVAAYRGYRRQALYALYRLLELHEGEQLHPEGVEDLSIVSEGRLAEAIQVKSYAAALTLSQLDPGVDGSFLQAAAARSRRGDRERIRLISFGPIGAELAGVRDGVEHAIGSVVAKLGQVGIEATTALDLLGRLEIEEVTEEAVAAAVRERLGALVTGLDPEAAFGLLTFWMYIQSERRELIATADARKRVEAVGAFIGAMHAQHEEWYVTIVPIDDVELSPQRRVTLEEEFYQGVSVRYEHVAAGLAVERRERLDEIDQAFDRQPVVVVHAASGQGKTTLAYQFLNGLPATWRFGVKAVPDRFHALRMAAALEGHATAVGLPVYVHLDVSPQDVAWPTLARELSSNEHIRVLVTIREEDWRRSSDVATLRLAEVDPTFTEPEARGIYEALRARFPEAPPTFAEAWTRFGGAGPLLEFVHLVTQSQELRERLSDQVRRLRREAEATGTAKIDFLRLASVIAATEARADLQTLAAAVGLHDAAHVVGEMEREYLVRVSDKGRLVGSLHPIRSRILSELLADEGLLPISECLVAAVPFVDEPDLEIFMLRALSRAGADVGALKQAALKRVVRSWSGFAGVARALRWRGIADYADAHRELIEEVDPEHSGRWSVVLSTDIAGAMPGGIGQMWDTLAEGVAGAATARDAFRAVQERQRPITEAFALLREWLERARHPPVPASTDDWAAFAEMHYFGARLGASVEPAWMGAVSLDSALETASPSALADLSLALAEGEPLTHRGRAWLDRNRLRLAETYRWAAGAVGYSDDGETVSIDFVVSPPPGDGSNETTAVALSYNSQAVTRLDLLRRLVPDRGHYAAQGWGHRIEGLLFDGTAKHIERNRLPPVWLTSLNATLRGYVERWWRPPKWSAYRDDLTDGRRDNCVRLEAITAALERFHRGAAALPLQGMTNEEWFKAWESRLTALDLLPLEAVDDFGFTDESSALADSRQEPITMRALALDPYLDFIKALRELTRALGNFANQAPTAMAFAEALGRANASQRLTIREKAAELGIEDSLRLSTLNLGAALKALPAFEAGLEQTFPSTDLDGLHQREHRALSRAFDVWRVFTETPWVRSGDLLAEIEHRQRRQMRRWEGDLAARLAMLDPTVRWRLVEHNGPEGGQLLVTGSGADAVAVYGLLGPVVTTVHDVLSGLSAEDIVLVEARLPRVIVVPLVGERSLHEEAVSLSTLVVASEGWAPAWWYFVPRPIPADLRGEYPLWEMAELRLADGLADAVARMFARLTHLLDLPPRDDLDLLGRELLDRHIAGLVPSLSELWHEASRNVDVLAHAVTDIDPSAPYRGALDELLDALRATLGSAPSRAEGWRATQAELGDWKPRVGDAVDLASRLSLAWATVVVGRWREDDERVARRDRGESGPTGRRPRERPSRHRGRRS